MPTNDEDEDDEAAIARRYAADALRVFAEIADNPRSDPKDRENARKGLEERLLQLKRLLGKPDLSPELRRDIEDTLRKFRHS